MPQAQQWTVGRLLKWTTDYLESHGSDSPRLDAEVLLAEAIGCRRIELYTAFDKVPDRQPRTAFRRLVRRRAEGMWYMLTREDLASLRQRFNPVPARFPTPWKCKTYEPDGSWVLPPKTPRAL